jgi:hypothetical protein
VTVLLDSGTYQVHGDLIQQELVGGGLGLSVTAEPEPSTWLLLGSGMVWLIWRRYGYA